MFVELPHQQQQQPTSTYPNTTGGGAVPVHSNMWSNYPHHHHPHPHSTPLTSYAAAPHGVNQQQLSAHAQSSSSHDAASQQQLGQLLPAVKSESTTSSWASALDDYLPSSQG